MDARDAITKNVTVGSLKKRTEGNVKIIKQAKTNIKVVSDGTAKGTHLVLNGKKIKNLKRMSFYLNEGFGNDKPSVSCDYAQTENKKNGFVSTQDYRLDTKNKNTAEVARG